MKSGSASGFCSKASSRETTAKLAASATARANPFHCGYRPFSKFVKLRRILKWIASIILLALTLWVFTAYWTSTNDCNCNAATPTDPMKAIRYCEYGLPNVVKLENVEKPVPNEKQGLIKVQAS